MSHERSVDERSVDERSVDERSVDERSVVERSVVERSVVERSVVERSVTSRPARMLVKLLDWKQSPFLRLRSSHHSTCAHSRSTVGLHTASFLDATLVSAL